jgi:hypothetical protein
MRQRIGFSRMIKLRCAPWSVEPGLAGVWRPTVAIPQGLSARLEPADFEAILHELALAGRAGIICPVALRTSWCASSGFIRCCGGRSGG